MRRTTRVVKCERITKGMLSHRAWKAEDTKNGSKERSFQVSNSSVVHITIRAHRPRENKKREGF